MMIDYEKKKSFPEIPNRDSPTSQTDSLETRLPHQKKKKSPGPVISLSLSLSRLTGEFHRQLGGGSIFFPRVDDNVLLRQQKRYGG